MSGKPDRGCLRGSLGYFERELGNRPIPNGPDPAHDKRAVTNRIQTLLSRGEELSWPNAIADSAPFYSFSVTGGNEVNAQLTARPVGQVIAAIQALDLETVKIRVMDPVRGEGWTREYADSIEVAYKTYLTMLAKYPDDAEDILLSEDVDEFWHTHILQTVKYSEDCQEVFGNYLHHAPHIGEFTSADIEEREVQAEKTRRLYEREFGGGQDAAWSGDVIKAKTAAATGARILATNAAASGARIQATNAAASGARIRAANAAASGARIRAANDAGLGVPMPPAWGGPRASRAPRAPARRNAPRHRAPLAHRRHRRRADARAERREGRNRRPACSS